MGSDVAWRAFHYQRNIHPRGMATHSCQFCAQIICLFAFILPPVHYGIYQRLRLVARDMAEGRNELVKVWIHAWTHHKLYSDFGLATVGYALADLLVRLVDELARPRQQSPCGA